MKRQIYFLIDKDKEKELFNHIENSLNCMFFPYFISEDTTAKNDVFLIIPNDYEKDVKYIDVNENIRGKKIYPFDEWANMIPAIEYSREDSDSDGGMLCRLYLNYGNMRREGKREIKQMFGFITQFIKKHSSKLRIDGISVYRL